MLVLSAYYKYRQPRTEVVMGRFSLGTIIYLIVGLVVASSQGYLGSLGTIPNILSALLAIVLWPLALLGVGFHL